MVVVKNLKKNVVNIKIYKIVYMLICLKEINNITIIVFNIKKNIRKIYYIIYLFNIKIK